MAAASRMTLTVALALLLASASGRRMDVQQHIQAADKVVLQSAGGPDLDIDPEGCADAIAQSSSWLSFNKKSLHQQTIDSVAQMCYQHKKLRNVMKPLLKEKDNLKSDKDELAKELKDVEQKIADTTASLQATAKSIQLTLAALKASEETLQTAKKASALLESAGGPDLDTDPEGCADAIAQSSSWLSFNKKSVHQQTIDSVAQMCYQHKKLRNVMKPLLKEKDHLTGDKDELAKELKDVEQKIADTTASLQATAKSIQLTLAALKASEETLQTAKKASALLESAGGPDLDTDPEGCADAIAQSSSWLSFNKKSVHQQTIDSVAQMCYQHKKLRNVIKPLLKEKDHLAGDKDELAKELKNVEQKIADTTASLQATAKSIQLTLAALKASEETLQTAKKA